MKFDTAVRIIVNHLCAETRENRIRNKGGISENIFLEFSVKLEERDLDYCIQNHVGIRRVERFFRVFASLVLQKRFRRNPFDVEIGKVRCAARQTREHAAMQMHCSASPSPLCK